MFSKLINFIVVSSLTFLFLAFSLPSFTQNLSSELNLKRKVAISRFSNETQSGMTFLVDDSGDRLGKQASDILSSRLTSTGKFIMFERVDKDEVDAEQILLGMKDDGIIGVDYLIVGSVSEFGRSTDSESKVFKRTFNQRAFAKVNVRLIDVDSGRIVFSQEGAGEAVSTTESKPFRAQSAGFDQSLTDKAISQAISSMVSKLVEKLTNKPWKSFILDKDGNDYIIAGGSGQGIEPGMELFVFSKGKKIKNPQTGGFMELPGKKIGTIRVNSSFGEDDFSEISFASLITGELGDNFDQYYISDR